MSIDDDFRDSLDLIAPPRNARVIDRASDMAVLEQNVAGWSDDRKAAWHKDITETHDSIKFKVEWPQPLEDAS